jgi:hypothetical protein
MSLKPAAADPPPREDRRGTDSLLPQFKDQMSPVGAGPRPPQNDRRGTDPPEFQKQHQVVRLLAAAAGGGIPLAEATPVADSDSFSAPTTSRNEEKVLRLEAQLELERQRVANLEQNQQPGGPPVPSTTTWKSSYVALGIVLVVVLLLLLLVAVVVAVVIALVNDGGSRIPLEILPRNESILTYINSITRSNQTLSYPPRTPGSTAKERAVQWLIEDDLNTTADDWDALRQRYALSTLWFIPTPAARMMIGTLPTRGRPTGRM